MQTLRSLSLALIVLVTFSLLGGLVPESVYAQSEADIKSQIEEHSQRIHDLEKEINGYQQQLNVVSGQKQTLQSAIQTLDITRQQTSSQINLTENKISSTNLKLEELSYNIADTEQLIALDQRTLEKSIRNMAEAGEVSLVEQIFAAADLTEAWSAVDDAASLNTALRTNVASLSQAKQALT